MAKSHNRQFDIKVCQDYQWRMPDGSPGPREWQDGDFPRNAICGPTRPTVWDLYLENEMDLVLNFASLRAHPDDIRDFMETHGGIENREPKTNRAARDFTGPYDTFGFWVDELALARSALTIWDRQTRDSLVPCDVKERAQLAAAINSRLTGADRLDDSLMFYSTCTDLLGIIWHQVARWVAYGAHARSCPHCGKLFWVRPGLSRTDREYCSDKCRVYTHRKKTRTARKMRNEGAHLRTIARELGTDLKTAKKWVGED